MTTGVICIHIDSVKSDRDICIMCSHNVMQQWRIHRVSPVIEPPTVDQGAVARGIFINNDFGKSLLVGITRRIAINTLHIAFPVIHRLRGIDSRLDFDSIPSVLHSMLQHRGPLGGDIGNHFVTLILEGGCCFHEEITSDRR